MQVFFFNSTVENRSWNSDISLWDCLLKTQKVVNKKKLFNKRKTSLPSVTVYSFNVSTTRRRCSLIYKTSRMKQKDGSVNKNPSLYDIICLWTHGHTHTQAARHRGRIHLNLVDVILKTLKSFNPPKWFGFSVQSPRLSRFPWSKQLSVSFGKWSVINCLSLMIHLAKLQTLL